VNSPITASPAAPAPIARPDDHPGQAVSATSAAPPQSTSTAPATAGRFAPTPGSRSTAPIRHLRRRLPGHPVRTTGRPPSSPPHSNAAARSARTLLTATPW